MSRTKNLYFPLLFPEGMAADEVHRSRSSEVGQKKPLCWRFVLVPYVRFHDAKSKRLTFRWRFAYVEEEREKRRMPLEHPKSSEMFCCEYQYRTGTCHSQLRRASQQQTRAAGASAYVAVRYVLLHIVCVQQHTPGYHGYFCYNIML